MVCVLLLSACASRQPPVVVERSLSGAGPAAHTVAAGETLYSIALRYDSDYHELARLNGLDASYTIHPGQRLRLRGSVAKASAVKTAPVVKKPASSVTNPANKAAAKSPNVVADKTLVVKKPAPVPDSSPSVTGQSRASASLAWDWPARGVILGRFGSNGVTGKGLDIAGKRGDSVLAAAAGTVVYAGSGLVGYGKLLIIRHDDNYISAYAHNDQFLVKEGDRVKLGQAIAEMGASGTDREKLHFEIRERGKPVDPTRFLPAR
ncbi:MAG: peptidoglycan DD-metalloendopeptidase family protein [Moraxellaceae bacterium]